MSPESQVNFELPPQPPSPEQGGQGQEQADEAPPARPEQVGKQAPKPALPAIPDDIPAADQPVITAPPQDVAAPMPSDPHAQATDTDRIEHVWVDKVKDTVARTREDPYVQSSEMSKIKADYNLKRFNKQIKRDEAGA
ncbi:MAG: hypothetical protein ACREGG_02730 [Candidatus Saccharimonadales bacterium]